jgi:hypothetical protein
VTSPALIVPATPPQEASTDYLIKIPPIDGESSEGKVEHEWKVEEGEKAAAPSIEPDEIDYADDGEPITPDFGILLGGGIDQDDDGDTILTKTEDETRSQGLARALEILEDGVKESDQAIESVSLNFEKITTRVRHEVMLFGLIPMTATASVDINADEEVDVHFPWWGLFATGKNSDALGERIFNTLSNVLKTKRDTIKNSIGNVR